MGGTWNSQLLDQQVSLGLLAISSDHNYCRVPSKLVEHQSRLGFQECNRLIRLEASSECFSKNKQTLRNLNSRSVGLQTVSPNSPVHGMEAKSKQFCNRCNAAGLKQNFCFWIYMFQSDRSGDKRGSSEKCRNNDTSDTHKVDTTLVYSLTKNVHAKSTAFTSTAKPIPKIPREKNILFWRSGP